ncbi:hypothetical protein [Halorussus sp. AFM4]|uniref:hypothetical protein n=1 Tax=Halorussus sp. AFM4 TaxID=3421651 RepID=UPI003EB8F98D
MRSRTATALVGLAAGLAVSLAAWYYFDTLVVFFVLPFVPILFRGRGGSPDSADGRVGAATDAPPVKECPRCGFRTRDPEFSHCPRDGTSLERR